MSSDDDSETAEWEREQMLRGTQSRRQQPQPKKEEKSKDVVDATLAKRYVIQEVERARTTIESLKKSISSAGLEIRKSEKRVEAIKNHIQQLEMNNSFFEELSSFKISNELLEFLEKHKSRISKLPYDQREMIDLLEKKARDTQLPMNVDDQ